VSPPPSSPTRPPGEDDYTCNVQVAELNAINANIAVIRRKRYLGLYATHETANLTVYRLCPIMLRNGELV
jgi:hypothetical protein